MFLDDETERQECVLSEIGIIYHGAFDDIAERNWNYGQVTKIIDGQLAGLAWVFLSFTALLQFNIAFFSSTVQLWCSGCLSVHHGQV